MIQRGATAVHDDSTNHSSLDERAYLAIREMIVKGTLQPGEQLVQETLAERLGFSRTPLRKAVATLAQEGFVEMTSRGAAFVRSFTKEELTSIWEIRAVLEGLVCRTAARSAKPQHLAYLRALITSAIEKITPQDWSAYREADREFHSYIAVIAGDQLLMRILDAYQILSISLAQGLLRPPNETMQEHFDILDAIEAGDSDRAEQAMVHHIRLSMQYLNLRSRGGGGASALPGRLLPVTRTALAELTASVGETGLVAYRDGNEAVVLAAQQPERMLRIACATDARFPLHATAAGKVLLAAPSATDAARVILQNEMRRFTSRSITRRKQLQALLEETRRVGFAAEEEEFEEGVCGLAVPVEAPGGVIAAVSLLVPIDRFATRREDLLRELQATAAGITKEIRS
jgi:DNA-binding GntR family transcriptional regulator